MNSNAFWFHVKPENAYLSPERTLKINIFNITDAQYLVY